MIDQVATAEGFPAWMPKSATMSGRVFSTWDGKPPLQLTLETRLTSLARSLFVFHTRKSLRDKTLLLFLYLKDLHHGQVVSVRMEPGLPSLFPP